MLIDAITFFDEIDMLEFRLRMLWPLVDKFVIVEADRTFSGNLKPYCLDDNWDRFKWAHSKIIYHRMVMAPLGPYILPKKYDPKHLCWQIETKQRNGIVEGCSEYPDDATIMIGDVDEIPTREAVDYAVINGICEEHPVVFRQSMFYYNLKFLRKEMWHGTIITDLARLRDMTPQKLRDSRNGLPNAIENGGWHMSHFGGADKIRHKIESYSHQENNKEAIKNRDHLKHCIDTGEDLYDRDVPITKVNPERFPDYFREFAQEGWW